MPPVIVTFKLVLLPEQIEFVPLSTELVALGCTVTVGVPDRPVLVQVFASVTDTKLYVVFVVGLTGMFDPLVYPFTVKLLVPSL